MYSDASSNANPAEISSIRTLPSIGTISLKFIHNPSQIDVTGIGKTMHMKMNFTKHWYISKEIYSAHHSQRFYF
jgi:hypothetical protein